MMLNASTVRGENITEQDSPGILQAFQVDEMIFWLLTSLCTLFGLVGNGKVIWILICCRERNPFTTYILNLAIADFGTLLGLSARDIFEITDYSYYLLYVFGYILMYFTYSASFYFLTFISLERCLSVLFPIWYRCHRPEKSSAVISSLLWVISGLLSGIVLIADAYLSWETWDNAFNTLLTVNFLIFTPIMVSSTLVMTIKICHSSERRQLSRLYTTILVTLLFFIVFAIPLSAVHFVLFNTPLSDIPHPLYRSSFLLASFNSSINPLIYYFVGRERGKCRESFKTVLKRTFRDDTISQGGT